MPKTSALPAKPLEIGADGRVADAPSTAANLLDVVPSKVSVSSSVRNPRDFPEHLVDGRIDTAWNGRTNDLVGGWIAFRVPSDARVARVELSAGYDKVNGQVDLFTANHRITKVRVSRNGTFLKEHTLDPAFRNVQSIPIDAMGGDFEIKVLTTLPGSKTQWKELVVSELRVVGTPGKERRAAADPLRVSVGGLDNDPDPDRMTDTSEGILGPATTIPELCAVYLASVVAQKNELEETAKLHGLTLGPATCVALAMTPSFTPNATYTKVFALRTFNGIRAYSVLVLGTPRGLFIVPITWAHDDPLDPGCPSIVRVSSMAALKTENGHFVAVTDGWRGTYDEEGKYVRLGSTGAHVCTEKNLRLSCSEYAPFFGSLGRFAIAPDGTLRRQD